MSCAKMDMKHHDKWPDVGHDKFNGFCHLQLNRVGESSRMMPPSHSATFNWITTWLSSSRDKALGSM